MKSIAGSLGALWLVLGATGAPHAAWLAPPNTPADGLLNMAEHQTALFPCLAAGPDALYVAWVETNGTAFQIYVKKYDGAGWVPLGGSLNSNTNNSAQRPSLAVYQGTPYVAWTETDAVGHPTRIFVKHYEPSGWVQDGGSVTSANANVDFPRLAINRQGRVFVSWVKTDGDWTAYARYLDAGSWSADICAFSDGVPSIFLDAADVLCLAKTQSGGASGSIYAYNGTDWQPWRSVAKVNGADYRMDQMRALALGNDVFSAWYEYTGGSSQIYVLIGPAQVAGPLNSREAYMPTLAMDGAAVYIAWYEKDATGAWDVAVKEYQAQGWQDLGGGLKVNAGLKTMDPNIAVFHGAPYVVWHEQDQATPAIAQVRIKIYLSPTPTATTPAAPGRLPGFSASYTLPNPFLPGRGERTVFYFPRENPAGSCTVRILDLNGRIVRNLQFAGQGQADWDGTDESGHGCEGGLYFYQITTESARYSGKIVLIR